MFCNVGSESDPPGSVMLPLFKVDRFDGVIDPPALNVRPSKYAVRRFWMRNVPPLLASKVSK